MLPESDEQSTPLEQARTLGIVPPYGSIANPYSQIGYAAMYNPYLAKQELKMQMKRQKFMAKYGMTMGMPGYGGMGMRYGMRPPGMGATPSMQTRPGMPTMAGMPMMQGMPPVWVNGIPEDSNSKGQKSNAMQKEDGWEEFVELDQKYPKSTRGFEEFDDDNILGIIHEPEEEHTASRVAEPKLISEKGRTFALLDWDIGDIPQSKDPEASQPAEPELDFAKADEAKF